MKTEELTVATVVDDTNQWFTSSVDIEGMGEVQAFASAYVHGTPTSLTLWPQLSPVDAGDEWFDYAEGDFEGWVLAATGKTTRIGPILAKRFRMTGVAVGVSTDNYFVISLSAIFGGFDHTG